MRALAQRSSVAPWVDSGIGPLGLYPPAPVEPTATPSHDLSSYVSRRLANRLATSGPIEGYEATSVLAALLLTDITGFTAYVEQVSASRPTGLEDLARDFDTYFADLVGLVYGHGGDVLAIAGDAFFSYWPVDSEREVPDAVMRAAETGLAIQAGLGEAQRPAVHRFQTRAGVSAGELLIAFVGGVGDRWELMPVGSPIDDVARAERLAPAGAVAIAAPAWELVRARCSGSELEDGVVELASVHRPVGPMPAGSLIAPDPPDELLAPFVPLPVRRRQIAAGTEWLQEKRRVTVVMTNLATAADDGDLELRHLGLGAFQRRWCASRAPPSCWSTTRGSRFPASSASRRAPIRTTRAAPSPRQRRSAASSRTSGCCARSGWLRAAPSAASSAAICVASTPSTARSSTWRRASWRSAAARSCARTPPLRLRATASPSTSWSPSR